MENKNKIISQLSEIQKKLEAPKGQTNSFGNYKYRSCEDIIEAVKPLMEKNTVLILSDEVVEVGGRVYVKATAKLTNGEEEIFNTAFARESEIKKGMDASQITGASSSYARKYALNGLLAIDDTKDADTMDNSKQAVVKKETNDYSGLKKSEKICDTCKANAVINPNTNSEFCPNWKIHKEKGETITLINKVAEDFIDSLPKE